MATYTIQFHANDGLYRSLRDEIEAVRSRHRTVTGLLRGLVNAQRRSDAFARSMGHYGGYTVLVDGKEVEHDIMQNIHMEMMDLRAARAHDRAWAERRIMSTLESI